MRLDKDGGRAGHVRCAYTRAITTLLTQTDSIQGVLHSSLSARVILNLREANKKVSCASGVPSDWHHMPTLPMAMESEMGD